MRYPEELKKEIQALRKKGLSLGQIYEKTKVPKTTIRLWIRNISLSKEQLEQLQHNTLKALQKGRVQAQKINSDKRKQDETVSYKTAEKETIKLSTRELFIAGVALYWGEGFRNSHEHRLGFCNSDPEMMRFYIEFLEQTLRVKKKDLVARLTLNISYKDKTKEIEKYWSDITKIPLNQFTKPFYQQSLWKKQYKRNEYHGVLRVHAQGSLEYLWKMKGWIAGLKHAKIGNTRQGSSVG